VATAASWAITHADLSGGLLDYSWPFSRSACDDRARKNFPRRPRLAAHGPAREPDADPRRHDLCGPHRRRTLPAYRRAAPAALPTLPADCPARQRWPRGGSTTPTSTSMHTCATPCSRRPAAKANCRNSSPKWPARHSTRHEPAGNSISSTPPTAVRRWSFASITQLPTASPSWASSTR
jgi:hypothetical protein